MKRTPLLNRTGLHACRYLIFPLALALTAATANDNARARQRTGGPITPSGSPSQITQINTFNAIAADPDSCFIGRFAGHALFIPNVDTSVTVDFSNDTDDGFRYRFTPNPGTFVENTTTNTATLTGSLNSTNPSHLGYGFTVTLNLSGRTSVAPPGSPFISGELMPSCYVTGGGTVDPSTWHFYPIFDSAILVGTGNYAGAHITLTQFMHAIQVGDGATAKNVRTGVAGWFMWHVDTQPTNPSFVLRDSGATGVYGDFDFNITGPVGQIGDTVYCDTNNNGVQDPGEAGLPNVRVNLFTNGNCSGTASQTQLTDANGHYLFTNLPAGTYCVAVVVSTAPAGCNTVSRCATTVPVNLAPGQVFLDADFCFTPPPGSIGDTVYCDTNNNGVQDPGEAGLPNVRVNLFTNGNCSGTASQTQLTDANGHYLFTNLPAGTYCVAVDVTTAPAGCNTIGRCPTTVPVNLAPGQVFVDADFCFTTPCTVPPCVDPGLGLGAAAGCTVLQLTNHKVDITGPAGGIIGNVCIAPNGMLSMSGTEFITGTIKLGPGATFSNSTHSSPTVMTNVNLSAEIAAANARAASAAALPPTQTFAKLDGSVPTITGVAGINVIKVTDISLSGKQITLTGPPGTQFIVNVTGKIALTGGGAGPQIRAGGSVQPKDILYNVIGTGEDVAFNGGGGGAACCAAIVDGTLLAPLRKIALSPGLVNGEVISGNDISIVSGSSVRCPVCP